MNAVWLITTNCYTHVDKPVFAACAELYIEITLVLFKFQDSLLETFYQHLITLLVTYHALINKGGIGLINL